MSSTTRFAYVLTSADVGIDRFPVDFLPAPGERVPFTYDGDTVHLVVVTAERVSDHEIGIVFEAPADHPYVRGLRDTGRSERGV